MIYSKHFRDYRDYQKNRDFFLGGEDLKIFEISFYQHLSIIMSVI